MVTYEFGDCKYYADKLRGKYKMSGPNWSTLLRFVPMFDKIQEQQEELYALNVRIHKLTDAIDNFLNDTREKESVDTLEQAMKEYGLDKAEVTPCN